MPTPLLADCEAHSEFCGLGQVFLQNRDAIARFVRARGVSDVEDLLHEVWINVASKPSAGPIADPLAYLFRCAHNLIIDGRRAEVQRIRRERMWTELATHGGCDGYEESSERAVMARETLQEAERVLDELGTKTKRIFYRYRLDGLTRSEVAQEMGLSVSAIEKHLRRAYQRLLDLSRSSE